MAAAACHAIIPAAGIGARMGADSPKQYLQVAGKTLLEHCVAAFLAAPSVATVTVALHPEDQRARDLPLLQLPGVRTVTGGRERADSVLAGLCELAPSIAADSWVLVHDAARPGLTAADVERLIAAVREDGIGAILAEPVVDTVKQVDADGRVLATLDRTCLWRAQTPQMFPAAQLRTALEQALGAGLAVTDEAAAMEQAGHPVKLVPGSAANLKVTVPDDLALVAWYLRHRNPEESE